MHATSYTSKYSNLSAVDLTATGGSSSLRSIEAAPVQATTLSGKRVILGRRKKLSGFVPTAADKVSRAFWRAECEWLASGGRG